MFADLLTDKRRKLRELRAIARDSRQVIGMTKYGAFSTTISDQYFFRRGSVLGSH